MSCALVGRRLARRFWATAITSSTITTVAVFLPIAFVGDVTGELFRPFALTASLALLASLVVALTIVPVLNKIDLPAAEPERVKENIEDVIGIDASATIDKTRDQVARIARHTAELIELGRDVRDEEIEVLEGWAGDLYGIPVDSTMAAMAAGAQLEAMITDPVYEGKSLAGLMDLVRSREIPADSTVLYAHLGGQPAINAYHGLWDPA